MSCFQRMANCVFGLVVVIVIGVAALYFLGLPQLDRMLADAVRREFMLPPSGTVAITRGSLLDIVEGQVEGVYVESSEARISGLDVRDVKFIAAGVIFDLPRVALSGQAQLKEVTSGELEFKVDEASIEQRWQDELGKMGLTKVAVELKNDTVSVSGVYDLLLTQVRIGATGELYADGTDQIRFKASDLELGGASIGIDQVKAVFSSLTPVIDLGQFKMSVAIDELYMQDGYLFVSARSMDLAEKLELERRRNAEQSGEETADEAGAKRLRLPTLDELKNVFLEDTAEGEAGESDVAATDPPAEAAEADTAAESGTDDDAAAEPDPDSDQGEHDAQTG